MSLHSPNSLVGTGHLGHCGPSDDPDKQTAYLYAFRDLAKRFIGALSRINDTTINKMIERVNTSPENITEAYDLNAELTTIIDYLNEDPEIITNQPENKINEEFLKKEYLVELKKIKNVKFDTKKLNRYCEELNDSYERRNYLSCALLIKATINHVPPIFGYEKFSEVIAHSGKSIKAILSLLEQDSRPVGDLHTHALIRKNEHLPSKNQIEPYKSSFEILIQEIINRMSE